mmetsp:Transcript_178619/g.572578  ORF Transcript_178619/g.572578 Transcript_178619/m.572578 type:complete len:401 (-) Transcript_178619:994-2196(-)
MTTPWRNKARFCLAGPVVKFRIKPQPCSCKRKSDFLRCVPIKRITCAKAPLANNCAWLVREKDMFHKKRKPSKCMALLLAVSKFSSTSSMPPKCPINRSMWTSWAKLQSAVITLVTTERDLPPPRSSCNISLSTEACTFCSAICSDFCSNSASVSKLTLSSSCPCCPCTSRILLRPSEAALLGLLPLPLADELPQPGAEEEDEEEPEPGMDDEEAFRLSGDLPAPLASQPDSDLFRSCTVSPQPSSSSEPMEPMEPTSKAPDFAAVWPDASKATAPAGAKPAPQASSGTSEASLSEFDVASSSDAFTFLEFVFSAWLPHSCEPSLLRSDCQPWSISLVSAARTRAKLARAVSAWFMTRVSSEATARCKAAVQREIHFSLRAGSKTGPMPASPPANDASLS